jgi:3-oxocholest-4-en-26-oyl-CoA dehydrogenase beta subunit
MDTNLDKSQLELAEIARNFFESQSPIRAVREIEKTEAGFSSDIWRELAQLDWLRIGHPETVGGVGGGLVELSVIYQAMGRTLVPVPHLESAVIGAGLLRESRTEYARDLLTKVLDGDSIVTPALAEEDASFGPESIAMAATVDSDGGIKLNGVKLLVAYANSASHLVLAARTSVSSGDGHGITLALVEAEARGLAMVPLPNVGSFPLFAVTFDDVAVPREAVLGEVDEGWALLEPILNKATVLRSSQIQGAVERLLEMSVEHAKQRKQFGKPIGSFQAVQYLCSDIAIHSHLTELYVRYAAALIDAGEPASRAVAHAKAYACQAARLGPERAHAVHAGIAFMLDFDVQMFTRRCRYWELDLGDEHYHRERLASMLVSS